MSPGRLRLETWKGDVCHELPAVSFIDSETIQCSASLSLRLKSS
jgi:hypothetical protein